MDKPTQSAAPYLQAACFCEKVLQEQDGVVSAIRIVDRLVAHVPPGELEKQPARIMLLIALKGSGLRAGTLTLRGWNPSGTPFKAGEIEMPVQFPTDEAGGATFILNVELAFSESGTHWFDIEFDGRRLTRMPLTVSVQERSSQTPSSPENRESARH
jgi:hypothetical protein